MTRPMPIQFRTLAVRVLATILVLTPLGSSAQIIFPFNTQQEFTDNFVEAGYVLGPQYIYSSSPGVGEIHQGEWADSEFPRLCF